MSDDFLDPKQALDVEPDAERNVERITTCCLDVNAKSAALVKGRGAIAWWTIWAIFGFGGIGIASGIYHGQLLDGVLFFLLVASIFGITLYVWPIRVWRTHVPMRFCRTNRTVYFHWKGVTYYEGWDTLIASLNIRSGLTGVGAPIRDPHVVINFFGGGPPGFAVALLGTDRAGLPVEQKAAVFWEYIRRFMEDGPEGLPMPNMSIWHPIPHQQILKAHLPFPIIKTKHKVLWPIWIFAFFPIRVVWFFIGYPTDLLYYHLAKRLQTPPFPPEMEEPCEGGRLIYSRRDYELGLNRGDAAEQAPAQGA
jgi:hypothetical protein